jgi:streptogramin lyase
MTTSGDFTTFPTNGASPQAIVSGPDAALWFVQGGFHTAAVGRITTGGKITTFSKGLSSNVALHDIAVGPGHDLWFTESIGNRIGRATKDGKITEYSRGISRRSQPESIAAGPDGAMWFTEYAGGRIGRITPAGNVTEFSRGITPGEHPDDIAESPDGAMWFTEYQTYRSDGIRESKIGRITMTGAIREFSKFDAKSEPTGITQGPDGNMWFVETATNRVGRVNLSR